MNIDKEKIKTEIKSLFNTKTLILIIVVIAIAYFLFPSKTETVYQDRAVPVPDERKIASVIAEYEQKLKDKEQSWLDKLTGQKKPSKPPTGASGRPINPPIEEEKLPGFGETPIGGEGQDTTLGDTPVVPEPPKAYPYDLPLSIEADNNEIRVVTFNPYLHMMGESYVKLYTFQRDEEDFSLVAQRTINPNTLDGIQVTFDQRNFIFNGVYIGAGTGFPKQWYLSLDAEFTIYKKLKLTPKLTTLPFIGIEARYKLFK